jgi:hypothetical protein
VLAPCAPVTNPTDAVPGNPSTSFNHAPATSSTTAAAGDVTALNAGWSHATASMSAAVAASRAPPTTKPKYRGPVVATSPGSAAAANSARTTAGPAPSSRSAPSPARTAAAGSPRGKTATSRTPAR